MKLTTIVAVFILVISNACFAQDDTIKIESTSISQSASVAEKLPLVDDKPIKNVIFLIGDGTGLSQIYSGQLHFVGKEGLLAMQTMPVTGLVKTYSSDNLITDSASGATAYSCGIKTNNRMIGLTPDGATCKTLLELAEERGQSTGIVSTSGVTHATPASFASHVETRYMQAEIAAQYLESGAEVILGGGMEYFIPQSAEGSEREDDRNLIKEFEDAEYTILETVDQLEMDGDRFLGLFSPSGMPSENRTPTLAQMTNKAIDVLSKNENGFFLMIEGSQIDWAGHSNEVEYAMREVQDFDASVKAVLEFAKNDGQTLVVLTADHETGGMTIQDSNDDGSELMVAWTTGSHTGIPVPLMAYGPHAIEFTGWQENTEVGRKVAELFGFDNFPVIIGQ